MLGVHSDDANDPYHITYLINCGWRAESRDVTVEFTATGIATGFQCAVDRMEHVNCKDCVHEAVPIHLISRIYLSTLSCLTGASPYTVANLSPGVHHVRVMPLGCGGEYRDWRGNLSLLRLQQILRILCMLHEGPSVRFKLCFTD